MDKSVDKWCESWEKNFDSSLKSLNKFKDDLKVKPSNLQYMTLRRCYLYLELLAVELEEIKEKFGEDKLLENNKNELEELTGTG